MWWLRQSCRHHCWTQEWTNTEPTCKTGVLISLLSLWKNIWDNQLKKRKGLFWLTVLEVPVHDWLVPFLWACGESAPLSRGTWQSKMACFMAGIQNDQGGSHSTTIFLGMFPITQRLPIRLYLLKILPVPNSISLGTMPLGIWQTFSIQTIAAGKYKIGWPNLVKDSCNSCQKVKMLLMRVLRDPNQGDFRSLHLMRKGLDIDTDCKAGANFYWKRKYRQKDTQQGCGVLWPDGSRVLIFIQWEIYKL